MTDDTAHPVDEFADDEPALDQLAADGDAVTFGNPTEVVTDGPDELLTLLGVDREPPEQAQTVTTDEEAPHGADS